MYTDKDRQKQANKEANKRYRERKGITQGITDKGITQGLAADAVGKALAVEQPSGAKPAFADLPLDVQHEIDRMCYETTGQRQASHTRAAMTERALHYQATMGKRHSHGATCV